MLGRRELIKRAGMAAIATGLGSARALALDTISLPFDNGERPLVKYPQKRPMIGLTSRPPQLETSFSIFNDGRPPRRRAARYRSQFALQVKGKVDKSLNLSLKEIRKLKAVDLVAVNQ